MGKTAISNNDVNGDKSISLWCHANSFGVLGELHTSCGETEERQPEIISTSKAKHDERKSRTAKKRGTVIVGDSMVKGLHQHKLANSVNQNVGVRCFPEATVLDMSDYIKPVLHREPDNILYYMWKQMTGKPEKQRKNERYRQFMSRNQGSCQEIKEVAELIISKLINREDNKKSKQTVIEVNKLLEDYCTATNLGLITHDNITSTSFNRSNLHLNRYGS
ncbi:Scavenger receptor cysteine-rich type 1 M130 [Paramuricea clavata]|uniref:Scavenger receptor cysteine-rich type 1 M130 n=1 Tax=Paramuricea clavata TaxID=317549 RepID=A0A7D9J5H3_PARCT|nr:Scavenger receptor cysteine-rich type 1 M130 [Paramuricea clavata]